MNIKKSFWPLLLAVISAILITGVGLMVWQLFISQSQAEGELIPPEKAAVIKLQYAVAGQEDYISKEIKILKDQSLQEQLREIVEKMKRQTLVKKKYPWWPDSLLVRSAYQRKSGLLILDFEKRVRYNHTIGAYEEFLVIKSIVKTIIGNFQDIRKIKILVGGHESSTLAGHVDITRPISIEDLY